MTEHRFTEARSPVSINLRCTCGWSRQITRRQNALARAAKVRGAMSRHIRDVEKRDHNPHVAEPFRQILNSILQ